MNSYRDKINDNIKNVHLTGVANRILQYIGNVRNESDISQARRWVMELLQNARDLADASHVRVRIRISDRELSFEHTGKVFGIKDIMSIIHQVSSKNPGEGIGQFGTGFMSTYQLSEIIELDSFVHEEGMPYKRFHVTLNRTGQTKEEILQAIDDNIAEINRVDEVQDEGYFDPNDFNTRFTYSLNNDYSRSVAKTGMDDLVENILYVLLFSEKLDSVELVYDLADKKERIEYKRGSRNELAEGLKEQSLFEGTIKHRIIYMEHEIMGKNLTVAAEYGEDGLKKISEKTPKLFIDFPLIGGQEFPFPVVLNHTGLKPNEPRSSISLVDNVNSQDSRNNKKIMEEAVVLYGEFLHQLTIQEYKGIENIISMPAWKQNKEWSDSWVKEKLYGSLYYRVSREYFIPYEGGKIPLSDISVKLIKADSEEKRENIRSIIKYVKNIITPLSDIDWFAAFEGYGIPSDKYLKLGSILENMGTYLWGRLDEERITAPEWCVKLYEAGMKDDDTATKIAAGKYAIFISQSKEDFDNRKLYTINELSVDCDIPEILKNVSEALDMLGTANYEQPLHIRKKLFNQNYRTVYSEKMQKYEITRLTDYIIRRSSSAYKVNNYNMYYNTTYKQAWETAWKLLVSCGPDEEMYLLCQSYWNDLPERNVLKDERFTEELWRPAYRSVLSKICDAVSRYSSLEEVAAFLKHDVNEGIEWLNRLYSELAIYHNSSNYKYIRLIPNQQGNMCCACELFMDKVQDELKEIMEIFADKDAGCRIKEKLVDRRIRLDKWEMQEKNDREIALTINNVVQNLLLNTSLSEAPIIYQEACTRLLGFIGENEELAQAYFPAFFKEEDQMKLLTPKVAVIMNHKAKKLDRLFKDLGADSEEDIDKLLDKLRQMKENDDIELNDNESDENEKENIKYNPVYGIYYDDNFFGSMTDSEREDYFRRIGDAGEEYALVFLKNQLMEQGYSVMDERMDKIVLQRGEETAAILRGDTGSYHQAGWDVCVEYGTDEKSTDYYEIKTHTVTSRVRGFLHISNEQMIKAALAGEHYSFLKMDYDIKSERITDCIQYRDPIYQMGNRRLVNNEDGYWWRVV